MLPGLNKQSKQISVSKSNLVKGYAHTHFYPLEVRGMAHLAELMLHKVWSPIVWKDGYRLKKNFEQAQFIALDFDDGKLTLEGARKRALASGASFILGTSKSHQLEKKTEGGQILAPCDRFRLVYLVDRPTTDKETYEYNMQQIMDVYPCDPSCKDAGRFFFGCKEIVEVREGAPLHWLEIPENHLTGVKRVRKQHERYRLYREKKRLPAWINSALQNGVGEGGRHQMCYRLGATMIHLGYEEEEIVGLCMRSPLANIGKVDIERAVANGAERSAREYDELSREDAARDSSQRLGEERA